MDAFLQSPWAPLLLTVVVWGVVQLIKALLVANNGARIWTSYFWALWRRWLSPAWWSASWPGKNLAKPNLMSGSSWPAAKPIRLASIPYWWGCWRCTSSRSLPSGSQRIQPCCPLPVICVGVTVFACVAVANDAYLGIRQNPRAMLLVLGIVVVGNLTAGFSVMESAGFADGLAVENSMNFIIAAMGLIILAALAIRLRMAARDEE